MTEFFDKSYTVWNYPIVLKTGSKTISGQTHKGTLEYMENRGDLVFLNYYLGGRGSPLDIMVIHLRYLPYICDCSVCNYGTNAWWDVLTSENYLWLNVNCFVFLNLMFDVCFRWQSVSLNPYRLSYYYKSSNQWSEQAATYSISRINTTKKYYKGKF